jgi:hypothetical protein
MTPVAKACLSDPLGWCFDDNAKMPHHELEMLLVFKAQGSLTGSF